MVISIQDQQVLDALRLAREQHQGLRDLLDYYHDLYLVQFEAKAAVPLPAVRDDRAMRWRLEGGIPQLTFDQLNIRPQQFASLVTRIADVCLHHGHPALRIPDNEWTPDELVELAQQAFETWDMPTKLPKDESGIMKPPLGSLTALTVGYALAAYLQRACETVSPHLDLSLWTDGYCPICGGRPNLALQQDRRKAHQLVCSRCLCLWLYPLQICPFCEGGDMQRHCESGYGSYRVHACRHCTGYLVAVDLQKIGRQVYPQVERLLTVGLDLAVRSSSHTP